MNAVLERQDTPLASLRRALEEVKLIKAGKKKARSWEDFEKKLKKMEEEEQGEE